MTSAHVTTSPHLTDDEVTVAHVFSRAHRHNWHGTLTDCRALTHCPSICPCEVGTCSARLVTDARRSLHTV